MQIIQFLENFQIFTVGEIGCLKVFCKLNSSNYTLCVPEIIVLAWPNIFTSKRGFLGKVKVTELGPPEKSRLYWTDAVFWSLFTETGVVNLFVWWNELKLYYMLHVCKLYFKLLLWVRRSLTITDIRPSWIQTRMDTLSVSLRCLEEIE